MILSSLFTKFHAQFCMNFIIIYSNIELTECQHGVRKPIIPESEPFLYKDFLMEGKLIYNSDPSGTGKKTSFYFFSHLFHDFCRKWIVDEKVIVLFITSIFTGILMKNVKPIVGKNGCIFLCYLNQRIGIFYPINLAKGKCSGVI